MRRVISIVEASTVISSGMLSRAFNCSSTCLPQFDANKMEIVSDAKSNTLEKNVLENVISFYIIKFLKQ